MGAFSYHSRVLSCGQCGAPLECGVDGGTVQCKYCQASNQVSKRDDGQARTLAQAPATLSEAQRYAKLREQDGKPLPTPPSLQHLSSDGVVSAENVGLARQEWQRARAELALADGFAAAERLYFLTLALRSHFQPPEHRLALRALLETTLEHLQDRHHRQVLHAILAQEAARDGDVDAADRWLELSSPHSDEIRSDTAYRMGRALTAVRRGDFRTVLFAVGLNVTDVPIADEHDALAALLRAHALEHMGQAHDAARQLYPFLMVEARKQELHQLVVAYQAMGLAGSVYARAEPKAKRLLSDAPSNWDPDIVAGITVLSWLGATAAAFYGASQLELRNTAHILTGIGASIVIFVVLFMSAGIPEKRLKRNGTRGRALVLRAIETGRDKQGRRTIKLLLLVEVPGFEPYAAWHNKWLS